MASRRCDAAVAMAVACGGKLGIGVPSWRAASPLDPVRIGHGRRAGKAHPHGSCPQPHIPSPACHRIDT